MWPCMRFHLLLRCILDILQIKQSNKHLNWIWSITFAIGPGSESICSEQQQCGPKIRLIDHTNVLPHENCFTKIAPNTAHNQKYMKNRKVLIHQTRRSDASVNVGETIDISVIYAFHGRSPLSSSSLSKSTLDSLPGPFAIADVSIFCIV